MPVTLTDESTLNHLVEQVREEFPGALTPEQIEAASEKLAALVLQHPHADEMVAQLARPRFMQHRRAPTLKDEKAARKHLDNLREDDYRREQQSKPRWTGGGSTKSGRWHPQPADARDEVAEARYLAFLDRPIGYQGDDLVHSEVLWRDATAPMLRSRRADYTKKILGLQSSVTFLDDQIDIIEEVDDTGTMTLGEALRVTGRI